MPVQDTIIRGPALITSTLGFSRTIICISVPNEATQPTVQRVRGILGVSRYFVLERVIVTSGVYTSPPLPPPGFWVFSGFWFRA